MNDKLIHGLVSFVTMFGVAFVLCFFFPTIESCLAGTLFALGLGIGKEVGDYFNPRSKWDWKDLLADVVGIIIANGVVLLLHLLIR